MAQNAGEFTKVFIEGLIALLVIVNLLPTLQTTLANVTGIPILSATIVMTVVGAGVLLFIYKMFI